MARWTTWRILARGDEWFDDNFDHDGPAVYELALRPKRRRAVEIVYVGETANESQRMSQYARGSSHIEELIEEALDDDFTLLYRGMTCRTKSEAKRRQDQLLAKFRYPWNIQGQDLDDE